MTCYFFAAQVFYHDWFRMFFRVVFTLAGLALLPALSLAQCTFTLSPTSASFTSSSNDSVVQVTASAPTCAWTATSQTSWITISFGFSGTGNGSVGFTVLQNSAFTQRSGSLKIAGVTFNVTQAGAPCTYTFSPSSATVPAGGSNGSFNVTTGCTWTASSNNDWLTASGNATGNGTVTYTAAPNYALTSRMGTISVGTANFTITQTAACGYTINPVSAQIAAAGASGTFTVTPSASSCAWTATSNNTDFVTVTSGASGTGNGTVGYTVAGNNTGSARGGSIAVGNTAFGIYQTAGAACSFAVSPAVANYTSSGGSSSFSVTSNCTWAPSTNADWISFTSVGSGNGNGVVGYFVAPNLAAGTRSAAITVGSASITINQTGVPCSVTVSQNSIAAPAGGTSGNIDVMAPDSCSWSASTNAGWIMLGNSAGTGIGSVQYTIAASTVPQPRAANITIANQTVKVTQDATACGAALIPDHASVPAGAGTYSFHISTACDYSATSNAGWIKIVSGASGTGESDIGYTVAANSSADARTGSITAGGLTFAVSQSGTSCSLSLNPTSASVPASGGTGVITVTATNSCRWDPTTDSSWIKFTYAVANGSGKVNYTVDPAAGVSRTGHIQILDQTFSIAQDGRPVVQISSVLNGANFAPGAVAPAEIVSIFGNGIGPATPQAAQLSPDGQFVTKVLANTRVLFDGIAAPLLYVSDKQIVAIVPYEVDGQNSTQMVVEYLGVQSGPMNLNVAAAAPALFTLDSSGSGQGAILNQDFSVNTSTHPAAKNSVVVLYATGEGQTRPPGVDGALLTGATLPRPVQNVTVAIGGIQATVLYAGGAPQLPAGVMQVNVRIPLQAPSGAVPVVLRVGAASSMPAVTVSVQ